MDNPLDQRARKIPKFLARMEPAIPLGRELCPNTSRGMLTRNSERLPKRLYDRIRLSSRRCRTTAMPYPPGARLRAHLREPIKRLKLEAVNLVDEIEPRWPLIARN